MPPKNANHDLFPPHRFPSIDEISHGIQAAFKAQKDGAENGKRPFAAILMAPDHKTVLLRQFSISHVEHAESEICRQAARQFGANFLWRCVLYSTWEPCSMCAGVLYWSNIGTLVYAASEKALQLVIGADNPENFTMDLACRDVFAKGQKDIRVYGPLDGDEIAPGVTDDMQGSVCEHAYDSYWRRQRGLSGTTWTALVEGTFLS